MNAQWLSDILLGDFEALRQVQCSRYAAFGLPDPFAPTQRLVWSLLGEWARTPPALKGPGPAPRRSPRRSPAPSSPSGFRGPPGPLLTVPCPACPAPCARTSPRWLVGVCFKRPSGGGGRAGALLLSLQESPLT